MVERRRRGWVGFAFVALFWVFNAAMALWMAGQVDALMSVLLERPELVEVLRAIAVKRGLG